MDGFGARDPARAYRADGGALALVLLLMCAPHALVVVALAASLLLPAAWSLLYYKRLERSGALES